MLSALCAMLLHRFSLCQPALAFLIADALDFESEFGIIGTDQEIVFFTLCKGYGEGWFGYSQRVESGFDIKRNVFPRAQAGDDGFVQRHL